MPSISFQTANIVLTDVNGKPAIGNNTDTELHIVLVRINGGQSVEFHMTVPAGSVVEWPENSPGANVQTGDVVYFMDSTSTMYSGKQSVVWPVKMLRFRDDEL